MESQGAAFGCDWEVFDQEKKKKKKKMEKQNVAKKGWDLGWRPEKKIGKFLHALEETFSSASLRPGPLLLTSSPKG